MTLLSHLAGNEFFLLFAKKVAGSEGEWKSCLWKPQVSFQQTSVKSVFSSPCHLNISCFWQYGETLGVSLGERLASHPFSPQKVFFQTWKVFRHCWRDEVSEDIQLHRVRVEAPAAGDARHDRLLHAGRAHRRQPHQQHGPRCRQLPHAQRRHCPGEKSGCALFQSSVQVIAYVSITMSPKEWSKNTFGWARAEVNFWVASVFSITHLQQAP